jgi:hypothetical protein
MHTFTWYAPDTEYEIYINHNGDMSGNAIISVPSEHVKIDGREPMSAVVQIELPAKMLASFSRNATLDEAVEALQDLLGPG